MAPQFSITACYAFFPLEKEQIRALRDELREFGVQRQMRGLVLIASEGLNATVCGSAKAIYEWKDRIKNLYKDIIFKDSFAERQAFKRWSMKIKQEIVGLKDASIYPQGKHQHLTPTEWQRIMKEKDVVILDARNKYEVAIGKFRGAVDPGIDVFHEFPSFAKRSKLPKDKKILLYCTGGIRCEKAILSMEAQGYNNIFQLEGGILAYLEQFPQSEFEGECFVFDRRVAVDQNLHPSKTYDICPHCGQPGSLTIICTCASVQKICDECYKDESQRTCSKRCRNELRQKNQHLVTNK